MPIWLIVLIILVVFFLTSMIRIASENERFAVFKLGRYMGLKGPGLVLRSPGSEAKWTRLTIGDQGQLVSPTVGSFKNIQVPVKADRDMKIDSRIRIIGFSSDTVEIMLNPDQSRKIVCEKCGHEMTI